MNAEVMFECGNCGHRSYDEDNAQMCCAPVPSMVWVCSNCTEGWDSEDQAEECCLPELTDEDPAGVDPTVGWR